MIKTKAELLHERWNRPHKDELAEAIAAVTTSTITVCPTCGQPLRNGKIEPEPEGVLIKFSHGLGDAVQLTVVLQHLRKYHPNWRVDVVTLRGKESALRGLCNNVFADRDPDRSIYKLVIDLGWHECYSIFHDCPSTKAMNCLVEVFGIRPDQELLGYKIKVSTERMLAAENYLLAIGCKRLMNTRLMADARFNAVAIHYEGNTSGSKKNLDHQTIRYLCETLIGAGYVPIILDWDRRSPLPDGKTIHCPGVGPGDLWGSFGSGDAEALAALIEQCSLFIGVDSGPQKVAGATSTPAIGVWTGHHPCQFMDICPNFLHLVPRNLNEVPPGQHEKIQQYFTRAYRHEFYEPSQLAAHLAGLALRMLGAKEVEPVILGFHVNKDHPEHDYTIIEDIYLRDAYKTKLLSNLDTVEYVLDIGAQIGTFARLWHEKNPKAQIVCVEMCPENIENLRKNVGGFATVIQAACTYETGPLHFLNSMIAPVEDRKSTGGSMIFPATEEACRSHPLEYVSDSRPFERVTVHGIIEAMKWPRIDLLKLDCEGSEFSILEGAPLDKIRFVLGEFHGVDRWNQFRVQRFGPEWSYGIMSLDQVSGLGNFHYRNDGFKE